jgi:hypothetical protein
MMTIRSLIKALSVSGYHGKNRGANQTLIVMAGLVPATHDLLAAWCSWMAVTRAAMTEFVWIWVISLLAKQR